MTKEKLNEMVAEFRNSHAVYSRYYNVCVENDLITEIAYGDIKPHTIDDLTPDDYRWIDGILPHDVEDTQELQKSLNDSDLKLLDDIILCDMTEEELLEDGYTVEEAEAVIDYYGTADDARSIARHSL